MGSSCRGIDCVYIQIRVDSYELDDSAWQGIGWGSAEGADASCRHFERLALHRGWLGLGFGSFLRDWRDLRARCGPGGER